ncbi:MAG TPA: response regulator [Steroidobacteraceae bacterium]|jgi:signal transduction histidine kinase/CheY-like chemotaxis protein
MTFLRRSLVALGIAAMLPTVVFAAFTVFHMLRAERERVTEATLAQSRVVMTLVDTQLQRHLAALDVLSSSVYFETRDWGEFYWRAQRLLGATRLWESIVLIDAQRRQEIFDLRHPLGEAAPLAAVHERALRRVIATGTQLVGNVESHEHPIVWLYVPVRSEGKVTYAIAAALKPAIFQDVLTAYATPGSTAAIVDGDGDFVARTLDYEDRIGTPATQYVREAIVGGDSGLYAGTTYEGLKNYTAYNVSRMSGWSTHLAVASASIDTPTRWSFVAAGIAALGGLVLGGFLVLLVVRDMAERRRAEEILRQSQKMEAIGQLTGGIAHDFNNLLTAVIGNLDMMRTRLAGNERLQRMADNALEAARKGAKLASQLLAFSRSQRLDVGSIDLAQLLNGMSGLLTQSVGQNVRVELRIDEDARYAISDANQLELALLNLAVNARDAMPDGGTLTIAARLIADRERGLPHVELSVADTGSGMTEEVRLRATEPFYTTKPTGAGTGLGLSQVYGVVRESGGTLVIESEPESGTTVRLILPAGTPPTVRTDDDAQRPPTVPDARSREQTRVLVVDDDRLVRRLMSDGLKSLQYQVTTAENGEQALAAMEGTRFDLLLVDFAMPGMNGADVARAAQNRQPGLKVLMVSGYADSAAVEAALGNARLLRKPFDLAELGAAVAETLADVR